MSGPGSPSPRRLERGEVSWVTLLLVVLLSAAGYLGFVWVPVWFERQVVKQTVRDFMNQAIKDTNDAELRRLLALRLQAIGTIEVLDEAGQPARRAAVAVQERDITWERITSSDPPTLHVAFEYDRPVKYPVVDRVEVKLFQVDMTADLARADWGSAR